MTTKCLTNGSDQSGITSTSNELSNDSTSYIAVEERQKIVEEAKLVVVQAKERTKRKIELLKKIEKNALIK